MSLSVWGVGRPLIGGGWEISAFIELCFRHFSKSQKQEIIETSCYFIDFLYKDNDLICKVPIGVLAASVLNCTIIVLTLYVGDFWCIDVLAKCLHENTEFICNVSENILKISLGEDFCKKNELL